jgi:chromosome segregation ATPase
MHTGIKSLEAKVEELQAKTAEGAGQSAGADEEQLKALKEGLQKEFKDGVAKAEENFNFRMDQMKVSDLASKCNKNSEELRELTAVCNVNSGNINKVDDKMKQVDDKMKQVEDSVDQQRLQVDDYMKQMEASVAKIRDKMNAIEEELNDSDEAENAAAKP